MTTYLFRFLFNISDYVKMLVYVQNCKEMPNVLRCPDHGSSLDLLVQSMAPPHRVRWLKCLVRSSEPKTKALCPEPWGHTGVYLKTARKQ
jgi:hypothetical protein